MNRWNILQVAFFGHERNPRTIDLKPNEVNIITGASGTGKSAIIAAIDYCLGARDCDLPWYVRRHAIAVAVHWLRDDQQMIVGRRIPKEGKGTGQMFVQIGRSLRMPMTAGGLRGSAPRNIAKHVIEQAFGIGDIEHVDAELKSEVGRASIRYATPYLFLSGDVILSKNTLLHDLNRAEKARYINAAMPYFLGAVDQDSVLAEQRLRQLEATHNKLIREAKARERSQSRLTQRTLALLSQAAEAGLSKPPNPEASDQTLLEELQGIVGADIETAKIPTDDELGALESEQQSLVEELTGLREKRRTLKRAIKEASGYETAVSGQSQKLALIEYLNLEERRCPICDAETDIGHDMAEQIWTSLEIIRDEVAAVGQMKPELMEQFSDIEKQINSKSRRLREVETQIRAIIRQTEDASNAATLAQARAMIIGRIHQFLETTVEDFDTPEVDLRSIQDEIAEIQDKVDPQAKRDRLQIAEAMISEYGTEILARLPTGVPAKNARVLFSAAPRLKLVEPKRRSILSLGEIGSDQNYLSIHLALSFALQKHFEVIQAPVPGVLVIDQVSRPYYPEGGDIKRLADIGGASEELAMRQIVGFLFDETSRRSGLQVILIEHAYIEEDERYVTATREHWTKKSGTKLIPADWPEREK